MPSIIDAGTVLTTPGVEQVVSNTVLNRTCIAYLSLAGLSGGDLVRIRATRKVIAGGADRVVEERFYSGSQREVQVAVLMPVTSPELNFQLLLLQVTGVVASIPYSLEAP